MSDDLIYESYRQIIYQVMQQLAGEANNGQITYLGAYDPIRGRHQHFFGCRRSNRQNGSGVNIQKPDYISAPVPFSFKPRLPVNNQPIPDIPNIILGTSNNLLIPEEKRLDVLPEPKLAVPQIPSLEKQKPRGIGPWGLGHRIPLASKDLSPEKIIRPRYLQIITDLNEDHWPVIEWELFRAHVYNEFKFDESYDHPYLRSYVYLQTTETGNISLGRFVYGGLDVQKIPNRYDGAVEAHGSVSRRYIDYFTFFIVENYDAFENASYNFWRKAFGTIAPREEVALIWFDLYIEHGLRTDPANATKIYKYEPGSPLWMGTAFPAPRFASLFAENPSFRSSPIKKTFTIKLYKTLEDVESDSPFKVIRNATGFFVRHKHRTVFGDFFRLAHFQSDKEMVLNQILNSNNNKEVIKSYKKPGKVLRERTFFGDTVELPFRKEREGELREFLRMMELESVNGITDRALHIIRILFWLNRALYCDYAYYTITEVLRLYHSLATYINPELLDEKPGYWNAIVVKRDGSFWYGSRQINPRQVPGLAEAVEDFIERACRPIPSNKIIYKSGRVFYKFNDPNDFLTVIIPYEKYETLIKLWLRNAVPVSVSSYLHTAFSDSIVNCIHPSMGTVYLGPTRPSQQSRYIIIPELDIHYFTVTKSFFFETRSGMERLDLKWQDSLEWAKGFYARAF